MKKTKLIGWATCFIIILCIVTLPNIGRADLKDIFLNFQPYISLQEEYSNNLDLTATNKKEDFITSIYVGLKLTPLLKAAVTGELQKVPTTTEMKYGIDLDFNGGFVFFAKEHDNKYISLNGTLNTWYMLGKGFTFRVREYLIRSDESREVDYSAGALPGQYLLATEREREVYLRNVIEPSLEYQFGRENRISINYRNNIYDNQSRLAEDSQENYISPSLSYWFNIRNGVSLQYGFTRGTFDRSPDFTVHSGTGRYTFRFNPRTSIFGEYSFLRRDFESPSIETDYDIHTGSIGMAHAFTSSLSGSGQVGYYWEDPRKGSTTKGLFYGASLTQRYEKTSYTLAFQGGYAEDFFTAENLGFNKYHRLIGTITHRLKERITVGGNGSFERVKSSSDEINRIWGAGVNGSYQIFRWMAATLDITHRENHSNISENDYSEYRGILRITATY